MASTQEIRECPICMDDINPLQNCTHTECGHCFHASCLMNNIAHNGFGCPYCRTTMATIPAEDEEETIIDDNNFFEEDDALRGFRFFTNNIEGVEHDMGDLEDENAMEAEMVQSQEPIAKPTPSDIARQLSEQGITMEHLIKALLKDHDEYDDEEEECVTMDDDIFGRMRIIISNFQNA